MDEVRDFDLPLWVILDPKNPKKGAAHFQDGVAVTLIVFTSKKTAHEFMWASRDYDKCKPHELIDYESLTEQLDSSSEAGASHVAVNSGEECTVWTISDFRELISLEDH